MGILYGYTCMGQPVCVWDKYVYWAEQFHRTARYGMAHSGTLFSGTELLLNYARMQLIDAKRACS